MIKHFCDRCGNEIKYPFNLLGDMTAARSLMRYEHTVYVSIDGKYVDEVGLCLDCAEGLRTLIKTHLKK